jgi:apolipoprotein N-acyltransferase
MLAGVLASAVMAGVYANGAWWLGFVAFLPWLRSLDASRTLADAMLAAYAMSVAFTAAVFFWLGTALGHYADIGAAAGLALLLVVAPLFQPQLFAFALARHVVARRHGRALGAAAGIAAWVATERLVPKLLDDTLGHALYPSHLLRQAADLGGVAGLTVALLLANEALAAALANRSGGVRRVARPLALVVLVPVLLAGYGLATLQLEPTPAGKPLRMGLVQSNIVDYERLRRERGAAAVVREVLDVHYAMTYDAVERQHAHAVLWSETVYPTTFGHPKSDAGAELDREILGIVDAAGVPFVFGTYERDDAGEYNAAAFVAPGTGLVGFYRKTRPFPLTEHVPPWLDGPTLRRWLPWSGAWRPGTGARVFPLKLADGREIPVLPLICLDDMDTGLAIDGARLGAQAIVTMSNDSWFTDGPGAALHLGAAAFRSIETRLPQFRVTSNGYSAVIDATGRVLAGTRRNERTLVIGDVAVGEPPRTLLVAWGNWVGLAGAAFLALVAVAALLRRWRLLGVERRPVKGPSTGFPAQVAVLPRAARLAAAVLRAFARVSLLWMAAAFLLSSDAARTNTLAQIRSFVALFLAPEAAAWCILLAFAARASIAEGLLVLTRGARRIELAARDIVAVEPWRVPLPGIGASIRLASGERWHLQLANVDPDALEQALSAAGGAPARERPPSRAMTYARARLAAPRGPLSRPVLKFVVLPLLLAIPAFRLHQHIAYGSSFGEYYTFGLAAYLATFGLWWAAWAIGVVLCAAVLRALIELATLGVLLMRPARAIDVRYWLDRIGLALLYIGVPSWLLLRVLAA